MIRAISGISSACEAVRIPLTVPPFVVMANDPRDLRVVLDLREDSLADLGVRLHDAPLGERQCSGLLEKPGGSPILPMSWTSPHTCASC